MCGDLEQRDKLMSGRFEARVSSTAVGGGAAVPAILNGKRATRLGLDGLCGLGLARGRANDDVGEEITSLHWGARVEKLHTLEVRGGSEGSAGALVGGGGSDGGGWGG